MEGKSKWRYLPEELKRLFLARGIGGGHGSHALCSPERNDVVIVFGGLTEQTIAMKTSALFPEALSMAQAWT